VQQAPDPKGSRRVLEGVNLHHNLSIERVEAHKGGSTPETLGNK